MASLASQDTLKVQYNEGVGGCFPMHFDTTPAISKRTLTAILCACLSRQSVNVCLLRADEVAQT